MNNREQFTLTLVKLASQKSASSYMVSGDKVQGIGFRKLVHDLMDERNITGLAVNDPYTGAVNLDFEHTNPDQFVSEILDLVRTTKGRDISLSPRQGASKLYNVNLSKKQLDALRREHFTRYLRSAVYNTDDSKLIPYDKHVSDIAERYRLKLDNGVLTGRVPLQAKNQLTLKEMPYAFMQENKLVKSEDDVKDLLSAALNSDV